MGNVDTISLRINRIMDDVFQGNKSEFARIVNIGESNVRSYLNGTLPKADVLEKIVINTAISCEWLLTGKGEMLKSSTPAVKHHTVETPQAGEQMIALYDFPKKSLADFLCESAEASVSL